MAKVFDFLEVKFQELTENVNQFIKDLFNKSDTNLSPASPYGQILQTFTKIYESSLLYLKNIISRFDINNVNNTDPKMVRAMARVGGYNPSRAISATGTISLQLRPNSEPTSIGNSELVFSNGSKLTNNTNGRNYYLDLNVDFTTYKVEKNKKIFLPIVQGKLETQTFTGTGKQNQSFSIVLPNSQQVEQYRISIKVNGELWTRVDNLNDMMQGDKSWYSKTGIDSGLDIYFGTTNFGTPPLIGSQISVTYVISDGSLGNLPSKLVDDFIFSDEVFDGFGTTVDIQQDFIIFIEDEIGMGADSETTQFTKAILPFVSRNFVLARPEQYIFLLKRLNQFSQIDAFTTDKTGEFDNQDSNDDSVIYIFLVPDISLFLEGGGNSYFDLDVNAFLLDDSEKKKITNWIRTQGIQCLGTSIKILDPIISKYVINVHIRIFDDAIEDNVRTEILSKLSNFFGSLERRGRIDRSNIISILQTIDGIDSVMVDFISEKNESYHRAFETFKENILKSDPLQNPEKIVMPNYNPNTVLGLDDLGDLVYSKNEIPLIRGNFFTRDGVFYNEIPNPNMLSSVNIIIQGISKRKLF